MDIADRILKLRGDQTREQFTEGTDTSAQTLYKYEKRTGKPTIEFVDQICKKFNIKHEWLITGTGPMCPEEQAQPAENALEQAVTTTETASCTRCAKMEEKMERLEEERRVLTQENRELWKENGDLREENATMRERLREPSGKRMVAAETA